MSSLQHSIVHRLPQSYRWGASPGGAGVQPIVMSTVAAEDDLIGLSLLSDSGEQAWRVMQMIKEALADIQLDCAVLEWEGQPCLFVARHDESTTTCHLKNFGVGIAEPFGQTSA